MYDICNYRAQLTPEVQNTICQPNGKPFGNEQIVSISNQSYNYLQKIYSIKDSSIIMLLMLIIIILKMMKIMIKKKHRKMPTKKMNLILP